MGGMVKGGEKGGGLWVGRRGWMREGYEWGKGGGYGYGWGKQVGLYVGK